jgi:hypothetical protein
MGSHMEVSADDTEKNQILQNGKDNEICKCNSATSKNTVATNLKVDSDDNKTILPKREKRCIKTKNEDFLWF